jgi:hypothetical protein
MVGVTIVVSTVTRHLNAMDLMIPLRKQLQPPWHIKS